VAGRWAEVMTRINAGEMPPEEEPRPSADQIGSLLSLSPSHVERYLAAGGVPVGHGRGLGLEELSLS